MRKLRHAATATLVALCAAGVSPAGPERPHEVPGDLPAKTERVRRVSPAGRVAHRVFTSVQVNVDAAGRNVLGDAANEPSIAVNPVDRRQVVVGWRQFDTVASNFRQAGVAYSTDQGASWNPLPPLDAGVFRSDPVLAAGPDGTIYYQSLGVTPGYFCTVFRSTDGGATWDGGTYAYGGDKAWLAVDRTSSPGHGHLYQAWDYAGCCDDDWFNRSTDGGTSFDPPVPIPAEPFWGVTAVGPDGEVYLAGTTDVASGFALVRSDSARFPPSPVAFDLVRTIDLGGELQAFLGAGPNPGGLLGQVWVAVDRSGGPRHGWVYVLASVDPPGPDPMDVHLIRSADRGATWTAPVRVNEDLPAAGSWQWFGTLGVAPDGRLDALWFDTRDADDGRASVLYYATSSDGGDSWTASQALTPPFDPWVGWPNQNKLGDYFDVVSDRVGAHVAFAATFNGEQDVYHLRIGDLDCNDNGLGDALDIASGGSADADGSGVPDECESDRDGDGAVDALDTCPDTADPDQLDTDGDGVGDACQWMFADGFEAGDALAWSASVS